MQFEKVLDGVCRYIDREILANMNDWQELLARIVVGRVCSNAESIKTYLTQNGFIRTMGVIDHEGDVDVDAVLRDIKTEIERKGSLQVNIPLVGNLTFKPGDIDILRDDIYRR